MGLSIFRVYRSCETQGYPGACGELESGWHGFHGSGAWSSRSGLAGRGTPSCSASWWPRSSTIGNSNRSLRSHHRRIRLIGLREPLGTGRGEPLARTRERDPRRALHSSHHRRRHDRRYSPQLTPWRDTDRGSTDRDSALHCAGHRRACCRALQHQRVPAGCVRGSSASRGLTVDAPSHSRS